MTGGFIALLCAILAVACYMVIAARRSPTVERLELAVDKALAEPLSIVQISDVHLGFFYDLKRLETVVKRINQLSPDVIVITGDLLDNAAHYHDYSALSTVLAGLQSRLATLAILGNHERPHREVDQLMDCYEKAGVHCLVNRGICMDVSPHIHIYGTDCAMYGTRDSSFVYGQPSSALTLLLIHQPDAIDDYLHLPIDMALSGHSHNGQVNLWGWRPILPHLARRYINGYHCHITPFGKLHHYVNRGLGTTHLPIRLNSRPQISHYIVRGTPLHS